MGYKSNCNRNTASLSVFDELVIPYDFRSEYLLRFEILRDAIMTFLDPDFIYSDEWYNARNWIFDDKNTTSFSFRYIWQLFPAFDNI